MFPCPFYSSHNRLLEGTGLIPTAESSYWLSAWPNRNHGVSPLPTSPSSAHTCSPHSPCRLTRLLVSQNGHAPLCRRGLHKLFPGEKEHLYHPLAQSTAVHPPKLTARIVSPGRPSLNPHAQVSLILDAFSWRYSIQFITPCLCNYLFLVCLSQHAVSSLRT